MCTVTIIPKGTNDFILTSNRDESPNRLPFEPDFYTIEDTKMLFPKDKLAGGTWIGLSEKNRVVCLLNGGYVCHTRKESYRMSRGTVVKDFMASNDIVTTINTYNLNDVEPFTITIVDWNDILKFYELVWDGSQKHFSELPLEPKIWSSSTLYSETMKKERIHWFKSFKAENELDANAMLSFHKNGGGNNDDYGVVMNRGLVKTTSITQVEKQDDAIEMRYTNLQDNTVTTKAFNLSQVLNG